MLLLVYEVSVMVSKQEKEKIVKDLLLTPIIATKSIHDIQLVENNNNVLKKYILSHQTYYSSIDEDMSDIAVKFYETIYHKEILDSTGHLKDINIAGDTMNSYNQIIRSKKCDEEHRLKLLYSYHCLANFWILPMDMGRTIKSRSKQRIASDYMDRFLNYINEHFNGYKDDYLNEFKNKEEFFKFHEIKESGYFDKNTNKFVEIKVDDPNQTIDNMIEVIHKRAEYLSKEHTEELFRLFVDEKLIQNYEEDYK